MRKTNSSILHLLLIPIQVNIVSVAGAGIAPARVRSTLGPLMQNVSERKIFVYIVSSRNIFDQQQPLNPQNHNIINDPNFVTIPNDWSLLQHILVVWLWAIWQQPVDGGACLRSFVGFVFLINLACVGLDSCRS